MSLSSSTLIVDDLDYDVPQSKINITNIYIEWVNKLNGRSMPHSWYADPVDQMLVFMGHEPRSGAKYKVPSE